MLTLRLPFCLQICLNMEQISLEQIVENAAVTLEADKALKRFSAQKALASLSLNILAGVHTSMDARSSLSIMEEALELLTICLGTCISKIDDHIKTSPSTAVFHCRLHRSIFQVSGHILKTSVETHIQTAF